MQNKFYLCSGFHRSGTSLVAHSMLGNGVNMGNRLMGASFANPKGHVEDMNVVDIHDRILEANNTDWRYCEDSPLLIDDSHIEALRLYIKSRYQDNPKNMPVGAKDPRALIFLNEWYSVLGENLKVILVYRDWRLSVSSLLKRHSRELLNYAEDMHHRTVDFDFWQYPDLAAMMWLSAANCMIEQVQKHPSATLLVEQNAFSTNNEAVLSAAKARLIEPAILKIKGFQPGLLQSYVPDTTTAMISPDVANACDAALQTLNKLATVTTNKVPTLKKSSRLSQQLQKSYVGNTPKGVVPPPKPLRFPNDVEWTTAIQFLRNKASAEKPIDWLTVFSQKNLTPKKYEDIFALAMSLKQPLIAETAGLRALKMKPAPWRWMQLGDVYMAFSDFDKARDCFEKAEEMDSDNATFKARLACVSFQTGALIEGKNLLVQAESMDTSKPAVKNARALYHQLTLTQQTSTKHSQYRRGIMPGVSCHDDVVKVMSENISEGKALDEQLVKTSFFKRDNTEWLNKGLSSLSPSAGKNLIDFVSSHLSNYWGEATLSTELQNKEPDIPYNLPLLTGTKHKLHVGVHLHVYYLVLLPEIFEFLTFLPKSTEIFITCQSQDQQKLQTLFKQYTNVSVKSVVNKGRDIGPWILDAAKPLAHCDVVLKLHTKATPHAPHLKHWRLQLLESLLGNVKNLQKILDTFSSEQELGMLMPDYLPSLVSDLNWGENLSLASTIATKHELPFPETLPDFPAGSMFWYRPTAMQPLLDNEWHIRDFPDERGQTDGTIMHTIERMLPKYVEKAGFKVRFLQELAS